GGGGGDGDLAEIPGEVVSPERRAPRAGLVRAGDQGRGQGMLDARAQAGHQEEGRQREHPARGRRNGQIPEGRDRGPDHEEPPLAPALGEEAGRDLGERHARRVHGFEDADGGERELELRRPEREEDVEDVREAVVEDVSERRRDQDRGRGRDRRPASGPARAFSRAARYAARLQRIRPYTWPSRGVKLARPDRRAAVSDSRPARAAGGFRTRRRRVPSRSASGE